MAFYKNNKKGMKNPFAANMSLRQQARRAAAESFSADGPKNFADLAPRGPLQVKNQVIGRLVQNGEGGDVYPDQAFRETNFGVIHIDKNHLNGAPFKMTVVCEVLNPDNTNRDFRGKIVEVLGDMGNNDVRMLSVLRQYGLSQTFPDDVIEEVKDLPVNPDPGMVEKIMEQFPANDQLTWDRNSDNFDSLMAGDILISDFSGIIFDFTLAFDKPILYADTSFDPGCYDYYWLDDKPWTLRILPYLGEQLSDTNLKDIKVLIDRVLEDPKFKAGRDKARAETWVHMGEGAERTVDFIINKYEEINSDKE